ISASLAAVRTDSLGRWDRRSCSISFASGGCVGVCTGQACYAPRCEVHFSQIRATSQLHTRDFRTSQVAPQMRPLSRKVLALRTLTHYLDAYRVTPVLHQGDVT